MARKLIESGLILTGSLVLALTVSACGSDDDDSPSGTGGTAGAGGSTATGGDGGSTATGGNGGSTATGGNGGVGADTDYTSEACTGVTPDTGAISEFPSCDSVCGGGRCVPMAAPGASGLGEHMECDDDGNGSAGRCMLDIMAETGGAFVYKECDSGLGDLGEEYGAGACVPSCTVPPENRPNLQQNVCGKEELCAPCVSPLTDQETGACMNRCEAGPAPDGGVDGGEADGGEADGGEADGGEADGGDAGGADAD